MILRLAAKEAARMALSDDLRKRVVDAVVEGGMSRNAAAKRFGVSIASAVRWVCRFNATGKFHRRRRAGISGRTGSKRTATIFFGLIRRQADITLLEIQGRLIANCGEHSLHP